jgi:hypothetical protein
MGMRALVPPQVPGTGATPHTMFVMRFTVVDPEGTVSFVAPCNALKALVAACGKGATDLQSLLTAASKYDTDLKGRVLSSLAQFDEHNVPGEYTQIEVAIDWADEQRARQNLPAFRVVNEKTRQASLEPVGAGLVLFNLPNRRIIQVQNTYAAVRRQDRGRIHENGEPTERLYQYRLPADWQILP